MDLQAAARLGDEVAHGFGLMSMVAGAVVGAVVGAALVGATVATGGAAIAIVAGSVAAGGLGLAQLVKGICTAASLPEPASGVLSMGSGNIRINGRPAMRASLDMAAVCSGLPMNHYPWPAPLIAEGSASVRFNGQPAARLSSKMICGAHIKSGSGNVRIGGVSIRTEFVWDGEQWAEWTLTGLGLFALGFAGRAVWLAGGRLGLAKFFGALGLGVAGFEGLGQLGDRLGPGYRDILQGAAGLVLLGVSKRLSLNKKAEVKSKSYQAYGGKGALSGRQFDPAKAGGPIRNLNTNRVRVTNRGVDVVKKHLSRFQKDEANDFMINRLEKIAKGDMEAEQVDLNFYTHELREYVRYRRLGWPEGTPASEEEAYSLWNNTHTATLEDYRLNEKTIPHPLYHKDAP
ncbi:PAAR domain-containing protein [Massilia sp. W12]|uniref:PAAR domain-containing protein n=1 Tax=Massilia sp. W12 TaxID=3126507 RepID=UPI0030CC0EEA